MYKLRLPNFPDRVPSLAIAKSYGIRNSIKLEGFQENFKVTLLERPPEKSYSTSQFSREISCKIFSPTKFQNHHGQLQIYRGILCNSKISWLKSEWSATHVTSHVPSWTPKTQAGDSWTWASKPHKAKNLSKTKQAIYANNKVKRAC